MGVPCRYVIHPLCVVAAALEGPVTNMISATALQLHDNAVVVLDADAASKLKYKDEYAFQFANDPKWAAYQPARKASASKAKASKTARGKAKK